MDEKTRTQSSNIDNSNSATYATNAEYFSALEKWLQSVYLWQSFVATFTCVPMIDQFASGNVSMQNGISYMSVTQENALRFRRQIATVRPMQQQTVLPDGGIEYRVPPLWKRFIAEFLDFLILFLLKLAVTFVAVDFFDFIDLDKYDLDVLQPNVKIDYKMALEMTSEILFLELIHRVVVCIFETFWLQRGIGGRIGGATPGKTLMGIRVVLCNKVTPIEGRPVDVIVVHPGTDLGLGWAFARSFVKNLVLAVLFPICFALFFFRHNRTGYDIMCHTIVVEDPPQRH